MTEDRVDKRSHNQHLRGAQDLSESGIRVIGGGADTQFDKALARHIWAKALYGEVVLIRKDSLNLQLEIDKVFSGQAFARPLFYAVPEGLRFQLSESGAVIDQFLLALRKSAMICSDVFSGESECSVCLRIHSGNNRFAHRTLLRTLQTLGFAIPAERSVWSEQIDPADWFCESAPEHWVHIAFKAPVSLLETLLWCALAKDFGVITPALHCAVYLFNLKARVMVLPYDDRGMDVVGPNKALLGALYRRHNAWLLDHDRPAMDAVFTAHLMEPCPRCSSVAHVRPKALLIGAASPKKRFNGEEKAGYQRLDQLAVDECKAELLKEPPLQQLVDGFYCDQCGHGFVASALRGG
jgi:hypothetical protein